MLGLDRDTARPAATRRARVRSWTVTASSISAARSSSARRAGWTVAASGVRTPAPKSGEAQRGPTPSGARAPYSASRRGWRRPARRRATALLRGARRHLQAPALPKPDVRAALPRPGPDLVHGGGAALADSSAARSPKSSTSPARRCHRAVAKPAFRPLGPRPQERDSSRTTRASGRRCRRCQAVQRPAKPPPITTVRPRVVPSGAEPGGGPPPATSSRVARLSSVAKAEPRFAIVVWLRREHERASELADRAGGGLDTARPGHLRGSRRLPRRSRLRRGDRAARGIRRPALGRHPGGGHGEAAAAASHRSPMAAKGARRRGVIDPAGGGRSRAVRRGAARGWLPTCSTRRCRARRRRRRAFGRSCSRCRRPGGAAGGRAAPMTRPPLGSEMAEAYEIHGEAGALVRVLTGRVPRPTLHSRARSSCAGPCGSSGC